MCVGVGGGRESGEKDVVERERESCGHKGKGGLVWLLLMCI